MSFARFGWFAAAIALVACSHRTLAQASTPNDVISGRWSLVVRTPEGTESRALEITMARDSSITGSISSSLGSVGLSGGRLERDRLRFEFAMAGGEVRVTYDLTLKADTLRGLFRQDGYQGEVLGVRGDRVVRFPAGTAMKSEAPPHVIPRSNSDEGPTLRFSHGRP
jgi:hypothetical protein